MWRCVRFENVGFRYPSRDDVAVLEGFTLKVEPNATVALVGPRWAHQSHRHIYMYI
jgi:ATP-binding cassette subfamily B protein